MRNCFYIIFALLCAAVSCTQFDDSSIWDKLQEHEDRIAELEKVCGRLNAEIAAQQGIIAALQDNDYVTGVTDIMEDGAVVGYQIRFSKGEPVSIYNGRDGADGADGRPGVDGLPGADGTDGYSPLVGVRKADDGQWYWTIDGEWMKDASGHMIPTTGKAGADGEDGADGLPGVPGLPGADGVDGAAGADGKDGITPKLKIEDGFWYVSYDNGASWNRLYKATMENGEDGESFFESVDVSDPDCVRLTLVDGLLIELPTWKAFQALQSLVNKANTNASSLQQLIGSLAANDYVTDVQPVVEGGAIVGYTLSFSKSLPVTIYHGVDGEDGADGADGLPGADGSDGAPGKDGVDGHVPVIAVKKDADGLWYWTVDGVWILDDAGAKVPVSGKDGADGMTPELKIDGGYWYVSYDGGSTWGTEALGKAYAESDNLVFSDLTYDEANVCVRLSNGVEIVLLRDKMGLSQGFALDSLKVEGNQVVFSGKLDVSAEDSMYSAVSVYYSEDLSGDFNIHTASVAHSTRFVDGRFSVSLPELKYAATYRYCVCAKVRSEEVYGDVKEFTTEVFGLGRELNIHYETGTFTGSGYFYTTTTSSIINGFSVTLLKSHMPDSIDALQFIVKGIDEEIQPLTAYVAYLTDSTKISTRKIIKSCTNNVKMTKSFSRITLPLSLTREEISMVPDDAVLYVGYYPPEGYNQKPIGCGYTAKTDSGYVETPGHKGLYTYWHVKNAKYTWAISSQKNPRYAAFVTLE